ncbi:MAG: pilus assembly protein [Bacillus sp. (in: Bacteria)]|nr:pilus assembly protein [Bacillus sp. (in: firmicutes)]
MIRNEKGQSLVEFVLVIPILLLLIVGIVDLGRVTYTYSSLHFTAQETVRLGGFGRSDEEIKQFAINHFKAGEITTSMIKVTPNQGSRKSGDYVTVQLSYPLNPITPFASRIFSEGAIILTVDSTIRIE